MQKLDLTKLSLSLNFGLVNSNLSHWLKSLAETDCYFHRISFKIL